MKFQILAASLLLCVPALAQSKGTPLPGLSEERSPAATPPPEVTAPDPAELRKKADAGDAASAVRLAGLILAGQVKNAKPAEAGALLEKAAESGSAEAQFHFARYLLGGGPDSKPDPERANFLIQQSAEAGFAPAQAAWGSILEERVDPKSRDLDYSEAIAFYRKAVAQDNPDGMCRLGILLATGRVKDAGSAEAVVLLKKAASKGHALALNEVGSALQFGRGVERDLTAAVGYFHAAADLGNATASLNLGYCYQQGLGVPQNYDKAGRAFADASKAGLPQAQLALGNLFEKGLGTPVNFPAAWVNYRRAAAAGLETGKKALAALEQQITQADLKKAQALEKELAPPGSR